MATPEQMQQDNDEYNATFNGPEPVRQEPTEDEAFGLGPEEETPSEEDQLVNEDPAATEPAESTADGSTDGGAVTMTEDQGDPIDPKDEQRQKSWEGRLKAREEALKAREDALAAKESPKEAAEGESPAEEAAEGPAVEKIEEVADQVESGEMTADEAMKTLAADFGEDFTRMLGVLIDARASEIAGKAADERVGSVNQTIDGLIKEIVNDKQMTHAESISDAHPDFIEVAESPEFREYIDSLDEAEKAKAVATIDHGNSRAIIKLLNAFKESNKKEEPTEDPAEDPAMDAAEGVRSSGLKIPDHPTQSDDYEEAWKNF